MGVTSSVSIHFTESVLNPIRIIQALIQHDWKPHYHHEDGSIALPSYLVSNSNDDWEWEYLEDWADVEQILARRASEQKRVGVQLFLVQSHVSFIFDQSRNSILVGINSVSKFNLPNHGRVTDFTVYLIHILPSLSDYAGFISEIACSDSW